ncbi:MAG: bifunctional aldolase/short-chain dehydrogenase [Nannocystaceae bacterium]
MRSAWSDADADAAVEEFTARFPRHCNRDVALRVYTSRLIGRDPALVLHGGGNTSVKTTLPDELGEPCSVLCVKGSGWDLAAIEPPGLPAVRLRPLQALRRLESLDDEAMVNAARSRLLDPSAPNPSVEVLLHAFLPHAFIDHSHADAILALVDQPNAAEIAAEIYGDTLAVVPYVMPGFALARLAAEIYEAHPECEGLLLLQHGLFTFGETARDAYERHIAAVDRAEIHIGRCRTLRSRAAKEAAAAAPPPPPPTPPVDLEDRWPTIASTLRGRLEIAGGRPILHLRKGLAIRTFVDDPALDTLALRGPATPDHVIRTKQAPLILDVDERARADEPALATAVDLALSAYRRRYRDYFEGQTQGRGLTRVALDPDPRVILIPGLGLCGVGASEKAAKIAADLYVHTIAIISDAEAVGRYQALDDDDLFDMEYWPLEQAKLGKKAPLPLAGRVVVITGAASGIGRATARAFAAQGAHLFLLDREGEALGALAKGLDAGAAIVDVCERAAVEAAIDACVRRFGGVDGLISNAGQATQAPIATCPPGHLEASLQVNLLAHQWSAAAVTRVLRRQGRGGFLLFNASKAAFNPGEGFGPYAVAKAGLIALMKQYALEHGRDGIRASAINADRVRTGLFPPEVVEQRAQARGLEPGAYFQANLLHREVTVDDVAQAFLHLALAESTTGAVLTVDGGNIAASPR